MRNCSHKRVVHVEEGLEAGVGRRTVRTRRSIIESIESCNGLRVLRARSCRILLSDHRRGGVREGVSLGSAVCSTAVADAQIRQILARQVTWHENFEYYNWT